MCLRTLLLAIIAVSSAYPQESTNSALHDSATGGSGMLYRKDHVFWLTPPPGWILDNSSGVSQGLQAVFYRRGGSWKQSASVMYANGVHKDIEAKQTFEQFIADDSLTFLKRNPNVRIFSAAELPTAKGQVAVIKRYVYSQYEAVAYIDEPKVVVLIVLTCRSKDDFDSSYSAFKTLVGSFWFITEDVTFPEHK